MPIRRAKSLAVGVIALSIGWAGTLSATAEETIRVATWNIANLHHVVGEALRPGAAARSEEDYAIGPAPVSRFFRRKRGSGGEEHAAAKKIEAAASEGLPL
jgi:hypothetical protein